MNAVTHPPDRAPDPEQDALDRMARNRAEPDYRMGSLRWPAEVADPLDRQAFRVQALEAAVQEARDAVARADCAKRANKDVRDRHKHRRAVDRATRALTAAERALADEQRGAAVTDAVLREDQVVPGARDEDGNPVVLRPARIVVRPDARAEVVTVLDRLAKAGSITRRQHAAGVRYRDAWEAAGLDQFPIGLGGDDGGGKGVPSSGNRRVEAGAEGARTLDLMHGVLPLASVNMLDHVIIQGLTVTSWALRQVSDTRTGMNPSVAMGRLCGALDVLAEEKWVRARKKR